MKIIVAHPLKQHSFRDAFAMVNAGSLCSYATSVYYRKDNYTHWITSILPGDNLERAKSHMSPDLDSYVIQYCELWGLLFSGLLRLSAPAFICNLAYSHLVKAFGKHVAHLALVKEADAVIMFDTTALDCFKELKQKAPETLCVLDASACTVTSRIRDLRDDPLFGILFSERNIRDEWAYSRDNEVRSLKEIAYSDLIITASNLTRDDYISHGASPSDTVVVPYGKPSEYSSAVRNYNHNRIKFLCASGISFSKGTHHLIKAMSLMRSNNFEIGFAGTIASGYPRKALPEESERVRYLGFIPHEKMEAVYYDYDVLVMPSLNDGFGFVLLEAMATGMPVIVSDHTGAACIIENGVCGFVYSTYSDGELASCMDYFCNNQNALKEMSKKAVRASEQFTWSMYNKILTTCIKQAIMAKTHNASAENQC